MLLGTVPRQPSSFYLAIGDDGVRSELDARHTCRPRAKIASAS
jgi:hypothetical protein